MNKVKIQIKPTELENALIEKKYKLFRQLSSEGFSNIHIAYIFSNSEQLVSRVLLENKEP